LVKIGACCALTPAMVMNRTTAVRTMAFNFDMFGRS
jgi:hypothetical protein